MSAPPKADGCRVGPGTICEGTMIQVDEPLEKMRIVPKPIAKPFIAKARKYYPGDWSGVEDYVRKYMKGKKE